MWNPLIWYVRIRSPGLVDLWRSHAIPGLEMNDFPSSVSRNIYVTCDHKPHQLEISSYNFQCCKWSVPWMRSKGYWGKIALKINVQWPSYLKGIFFIIINSLKALVLSYITLMSGFFSSLTIPWRQAICPLYLCDSSFSDINDSWFIIQNHYSKITS